MNCVSFGNIELNVECGIRWEIASFKELRPNWNPVSPPELSADAPVAFFAEPTEVRLFVAFGVEHHSAVVGGVDGGLGEAGATVFPVAHLHEPLLGQVRFDGGLRAIAVLERNLAVFHLLEVAEPFHFGDHGVSRDEAIQALPLPGVLVQRAAPMLSHISGFNFYLFL